MVESQNSIAIYQSEDGGIRIEVQLQQEKPANLKQTIALSSYLALNQDFWVNGANG
jgi:hypothetical protein